MNVILIVSDTVRQDFLGCYGSTWVDTPHIDTLARESVKFTNCFPASFPTRPHRKDLLTGRFTFTYDRWTHEWDKSEILLAELLKAGGYTTAMIHDTPFLNQMGRGFDHIEFIEGQEAVDVPKGTRRFKLPAKASKLRTPTSRLQRRLWTESTWEGEEDRFVCKTMRAAHRWLESQHKTSKPFFLYLDTFDPHEPWDPPGYYVDKYNAGYKGDSLFEPAYDFADYASKEEIHHMRCLYAAELTMVDRWIGYLIDGLKRMGLYDSTAIIFTSDHGYYLGDHTIIGKMRLARKGHIIHRLPLYDSIIRIPMLLRIPGIPGGRVRSQLCQTPDITSTVLELTNVTQPDSVQGKSMIPLIKDSRQAIRDVAVSSFTMLQDYHVRAPVNIRTKKHLYVHGGDEWQHELFDLPKDPEQKKNIFRSNRKKAHTMHERYITFLHEIGCPDDLIELREQFNAPPRKKVPQERWI